ncbi:hypothetical protein Cni_G10817 [Canna indica]|uniref:Uncharacterized protein n=1 Tax=Canna indica TaxID=4628 RepID=A0AAQ3QAM9_9LILI|nr:hypothetical protein Cni_G10817 [Canna indica]
MESIFCLRSALNISPSKSPPRALLPFPRRHPTTATAFIGHLINFPRSVPLHHRISCSHVPLPPPPPKQDDDGKKDRVGGRKIPRVAAAGAAVVLACALGAVYLSRGAPVVACTTAKTEMTLEDGNVNMDKIREEVRDILFKKKNLGELQSDHLLSKQLGKHDRYEAAFSLIELLLERRYYREARAICQNMCDLVQSDARPRLLVAVLDMLLVVEAMLTPNSTDVIVLMKRAKESWERIHEAFGAKLPNVAQ